MIDLSKATKLREVAFWFKPDATWIASTLRSITPEHRDFQKVSIFVNPYYDTSADDPVDSKEVVGDSG